MFLLYLLLQSLIKLLSSFRPLLPLAASNGKVMPVYRIMQVDVRFDGHVRLIHVVRNSDNGACAPRSLCRAPARREHSCVDTRDSRHPSIDQTYFFGIGLPWLSSVCNFLEIVLGRLVMCLHCQLDQFATTSSLTCKTSPKMVSFSFVVVVTMWRSLGVQAHQVGAPAFETAGGLVLCRSMNSFRHEGFQERNRYACAAVRVPFLLKKIR